MTASSTFAPLWASPPGRTISTRLSELDIPIPDFASRIGQSPAAAEALLRGDSAITIELAARLAEVLGASAAFWFTRECRYRESLERIETKDWVETIPFREMAAAGWVTSARDWLDKASELFRFFGVDDLVQWRANYVPLLAGSHLRISPSISTVEGALAAWLRRATSIAEVQAVPKFDQAVLRDKLDSVRGLTRVRSPESFLPRLSAELAEAGVALVVLPTIPGSPVSGAARVLPDGRAMLVVSGRFLADDQLWFTVFHEIGHLLMHAHRGLYIDDLSAGGANSEDEAEANRFAGDTLLPAKFRNEIPRRPTLRTVIQHAQQAGVSPGVVVGQLQFDDRLSYESFLNSAKRRYRWVGSSLRSV